MFSKLVRASRPTDLIFISIMSITNILSLENLRRRPRYLMKDGFVSRCILTFLLIIYSNFAIPLRFKTTQVLMNSCWQVSLHHQQKSMYCCSFHTLSSYAKIVFWLCVFLSLLFFPVAVAVVAFLGFEWVLLFFFFTETNHDFFCVSKVNQVVWYVNFY